MKIHKVREGERIVTLSKKEAVWLIAYLTAQLGETNLPMQQTGSTFSTGDIDGVRWVFTTEMGRSREL